MQPEYAARRIALLEEVVRAHGTTLRMHSTYLACVRESLDVLAAEERRGDMVTRIRGCGHRFNAASLERALQERPTCPMCRYDITCTRIRAHSVV